MKEFGNLDLWAQYINSGQVFNGCSTPTFPCSRNSVISASARIAPPQVLHQF